MRWQEASGRATLYTYSIIYMNDLAPFNERLPYVAAAVDLEEGPRLMTNIVGIDPSELEVGMALEVLLLQAADDVGLPFWRPAVG